MFESWKAKWGLGLSVSFAILVQVLPIPNQLRWPLTGFFFVALIVCLIGWYRASTAVEGGGDLRLTILDFEHDNDNLSANVMFRNDDSVQRTVLGVSFLCRWDRRQHGWAMYKTGGTFSPFIGTIDPVKIAPKSEEVRRYAVAIDGKLLTKPGAQAGLLITFTVPNHGEDSATVVAMEKERTGDLKNPSTKCPIVRNLSLDSIADSKKLTEIIQSVRAPRRPGLIRRVFNSFDY